MFDCGRVKIIISSDVILEYVEEMFKTIILMGENVKGPKGT